MINFEGRMLHRDAGEAQERALAQCSFTTCNVPSDGRSYEPHSCPRTLSSFEALGAAPSFGPLAEGGPALLEREAIRGVSYTHAWAETVSGSLSAFWAA